MGKKRARGIVEESDSDDSSDGDTAARDDHAAKATKYKVSGTSLVVPVMKR